MNSKEYADALHRAWLLCHLADTINVVDALELHGRFDTVAPIVDPSAFLRAQEPDNARKMAQDKTILAKVREVQLALEAMREAMGAERPDAVALTSVLLDFSDKTIKALAK